MRRILSTLGITALLALVASPALARPNSPNGRTPNSQHGWVVDKGHGSMRVERVAPAPYIAPVQLRRAKAFRTQYVAQKSRLLSQIRAQRLLIRSLEARPYHSRGRVRSNVRKINAAKLRLSQLELKLSSLELMYQNRLARFMAPDAVRFFNVTFG